MSHYFITPEGPERRHGFTARVWDHDLRFTSANGVFSATGLDRGTAVLLRESDPPTGTPRVLDLGCGVGTIAVSVAVACPGAQVDAVDVNERALALTAENAALNGVGQRVRTLLPGDVEADVRYDEIWSNPPIRIGKPALHELLLTWLPRLAPTGVARLVVGKNLGADTLARWIGEQGFAVERPATAKGFRVLAVRHTA